MNKKIISLLCYITMIVISTIFIPLQVEAGNLDFTVTEEDVLMGERKAISIYPNSDLDEMMEIRIELPKNVNYDNQNSYYLSGSEENKLDYDNESKEIVINKNEDLLQFINLELNGDFFDTKTIQIKVLKENGVISEQLHELDKIHENTVKRNSLTQSFESKLDLQRDIKIEPVNYPILAGQDALFKLTLKTTGSQVKYDNSTLMIELPKNEYVSFEQNLKELMIAGVTPSYNKEEGKLVYNFESLKSGQTYEKIIKIKTKNGFMKNDEKIPISAKLFVTHNGESDYQGTNTETMVNTSGAVHISKQVKRIEYQGEIDLAKPNGDILWEVKISVPHKKEGQLFLDPSGTILVGDQLPKGLTFSKMEGLEENLKPKTISEEFIGWELPAPEYEEQKNVSANNIYEVTLNYWTKIEDNESLVDQTLNNKVLTQLSFNDGSNIENQADASVRIFDSKGQNWPLEGAVYVPAHMGPADTVGSPSLEELNANPVGDDSSLFLFAHAVVSYEYGKEHAMKEFEYEYMIDPHLRLEAIYPPQDDTWLVLYEENDYFANVSLSVQPKYDTYLTYLDDGIEKEKVIKDITSKKIYTLADFDLSKDTIVTKIRHVFKEDIPRKMGNYDWFKYYFTVEEGYTGEVNNKLNLLGKSTYNPESGEYSDGSTYYDFNYRKENPDYYDPQKNNVSGDRTAQIVSTESGGVPTAEVGISLVDNRGGIVQVGKNKMKIDFLTSSSSVKSIKKPLEAVVLLAPGVKISQNPNITYTGINNNQTTGNYEIISDNFNNSGRQLVKFKWDDEYIRVSNKLTATIDVEIDGSAPNSLYFDVYGFSGDKELKVPIFKDSVLTNTILQTDQDDLNGNDDVEQPRLKSGNVYYLTSEYDLQTEKFVKGPGEDWSKFAKTVPNGPIDYKLHLTNSTGREISNMTLIDVLPSEGDLGITDNISRGSLFTPVLTGAIQLPKEWQNKVKVYYSQSKNPNRDDLTRYTDYPRWTEHLTNPVGAETPNWVLEEDVRDWSTIHSFKIELLPGVAWISGVDMNVTFNMKAPSIQDLTDTAVLKNDTPEISRAAWNSFAVATDKGQPVEPLQVGVYMEQSIGRLEVVKKDSKTGETLPGAKFKLTTSRGEIISEGITDKQGLFIVEELPFGDYLLEEVKAPEGYNLLQESISFSIKTGNGNQKENYQISLEVENTKQGWMLPNSGGIGTKVFYVTGSTIIFIGLSVAVMSIRRKRLKN